MARITREELLSANDLEEREVELPSIGGSVLIRSLPAAYSKQAQSEALETVQIPGQRRSTTHFNMVKLEQLQVLNALVDPKLNSLAEVGQFSKQCGPAWHTLVEAIDEISGIDKKSIEEANAQFRDGVRGEEGSVGSGQSEVPAGDG